MKKLFPLTAALALASLLLAGCWDRREINDLAFVMALGIDKGSRPGTFIFTAQVAVPSEFAASRGQGGGGDRGSPLPPVWITSVEGESLMDARRRLAEWGPRRDYYAHAEVVVLGEELARQGIAEVLDFLQRHPEVRRTSHLFVAEGTAQSILQAHPRLDPIPGMAVRSLVRWSPLAGTAQPVTLQEALCMLFTGRTQLVLPRLALTTALEQPPGQAKPTDAQGGNTSEGGANTSEGSSSDGRREKGGKGPAKEAGEGAPPKPHGSELRLMGGAVFKGDRLVGWLDRRETRGYMWIRGQKHGGITIVSPTPAPPGRASIEIIRGRARLVPELVSGRLRMRVQVKEEGNVVESMAPLDFTKAELVRSLERRTATAIRGEIMAALQRAQKEYRSDIFGFGAAVYRRYPGLWRQIEQDWDRIYPDLEVVVEVTSRIRRTMQTYQGLPLSSSPPQPEQRQGGQTQREGQKSGSSPHQGRSGQGGISSPSARGGTRP
ncbi:MAG: Ger(x)C family spore germination protein [Bacillota bacterium]|nr:Ger(x)C family spore germination protein [Bacillota bacterium]